MQNRLNRNMKFFIFKNTFYKWLSFTGWNALDDDNVVGERNESLCRIEKNLNQFFITKVETIKKSKGNEKMIFNLNLSFFRNR